MTTSQEIKVPTAAFQAATGDVVVTQVTTNADKKLFIEFPFEIYRKDPTWVPPLLMERNDFLNPKKNPWFEFGQLQLFLARRHGKIVGRIAALEDKRYNEFNKSNVGWFGFFECIDDVAVAKALISEAEAWVQKRGLSEMMGPASLSANSEWGLLVEGFSESPVLMMPYNPKYYPQLLDRCGLKKAKDLWAWRIDVQKPIPEKIARVAEKIRQREGVVVRQANMKNWNSEVKIIKEIYNSAWDKNWGFTPMTDNEFAHLAKDLKMLLKPELCLIAEVKGEAVAFCITLPDANIAIREARGKLTSFGIPIGLVKLLLAMKKIRSGRLVIMGIKEGFRRRGLDSLLVMDTFNNARKMGWWGGEISWTLENNDMVNRLIELFGCEKYKTYRVYTKPVAGSKQPSTSMRN